MNTDYIFDDGLDREQIIGSLDKKRKQIAQKIESIKSQIADLYKQMDTLDQEDQKVIEMQIDIQQRFAAIQPQRIETDSCTMRGDLSKKVPPQLIQEIMKFASYGGLKFWFLSKKLASSSQVQREVTIPLYHIRPSSSYLTDLYIQCLLDRGVIPDNMLNRIEYNEMRPEWKGSDTDRHIGTINYYNILLGYIMPFSPDPEDDLDVVLGIGTLREISLPCSSVGPDKRQYEELVGSAMNTIKLITAVNGMLFQATHDQFRGEAVYYIDMDNIDLEICHCDAEIDNLEDMQLDFPLSTYGSTDSPPTGKMIFNRKLFAMFKRLGVTVNYQPVSLTEKTTCINIDDTYKSRDLRCLHDDLNGFLYGYKGQMTGVGNPFRSRHSKFISCKDKTKPEKQTIPIDYVKQCIDNELNKE